VQAQVIRGDCPHAGVTEGQGKNKPPITFALSDEAAVLIGFLAEDSGGILTHHGSRKHIHALDSGAPSKTGHVDFLQIFPGSTIRLLAK